MTRVLLVAGTCGLFGWDKHASHSEWWRAGSPFARALELRGFELAGKADPYSWTGDLDGLVARHADWEAAGNALRWWAASNPVDAVVGHSHALQVIAYARLPVRRLVTVGSPVRQDMMDRLASLASVVGSWTHLWSPVDVWQLAGEIRDGSWWPRARRVPFAHNVEAPGRSHHGLLDVDLWHQLRAWRWLT